MKEVSDHGGFLMIHAENDSICESLTEKYLQTGTATAANYPDSRPNIAEAECISRMVYFAEQTGAKLYFVHVSTKEGVKIIKDAQRRGVHVKAETCPHYLLLPRDRYSDPDGYKYIMSPPLRDKEDLDSLWKGIEEGVLSIVSSDHCAFSEDKKIAGKTDFTNVSPGVHGTEWLMPLMYHFGVNEGRISRQHLVQLLSYNPARLFGLPQKGNIGIGLDADLLIFDPNKEYTITDTNHHMSSDFSPYNGFTLKGYPETVISRGQVIVNENHFYGQKGYGQFLTRSIGKHGDGSVLPRKI
jgi:dihydropyrimidinase